MVVALFFGFTAQAQTADWQAVQNLKPGSYILVKAQHRYRCSVELIFERHLPRSLRMSTLRILRSEILEVRRLPQPNQAKDAWIEAAMGAGAGATVAARTSKPHQAPMRFSELSEEQASAL